MKESGIYYKAFSPNLCGWGGYQYEIGKECTVDNGKNPDDCWAWAHYSPFVEVCVHHAGNLLDGFPMDALPRICEVVPIGETHKFRERYGDRMRCYYTAHSIRIGRELSHDEIIRHLWDEKAEPMYFLKMYAPFEDLEKMKTKFRGEAGARAIIGLSYLTYNQKKALLAKCHHRTLDLYENIRKRKEVSL